MNIPKDLMYTKTHEWVKDIGDGKVRIGLTDYAQSELGDLVFINLPSVEDAMAMGETFCDVESVKAVSDVYSPVTAIVLDANEELVDHPELVNADCYNAWLVEAGEVTQKEELLSPEAYEALIAKEG